MGIARNEPFRLYFQVNCHNSARPMTAMTAVAAKNAFGPVLEASLREAVAVTKNRREVAAIFSKECVRALADSFLADPRKADLATGKLALFDAVMAQMDINRHIDASRRAIADGDGIVADATYFASLSDRAPPRIS
ncbi:hypothetical protein [Meridianimarinicoccus roseus]|nr:hypothetical protein [Meridianimarinicoccus roseus]